jgi:phosphonate transport system substrate-binding protein
VALRLISYLSPSIPQGLFELVAQALRDRLGVPVGLAFETRVSGPSPEDDPFAGGRADLAFVCAPSYPLLKEAGSPVALLPAAPVFADPRAGEKPVYFSDLVVRAEHPARDFAELAGSVFAYNDRASRSGWQNVLDRIDALGPARPPEAFFSRLIHSGSHLQSLALISAGRADVAAIDSNTLWLARRRDRDLSARLRVLESWGPMPIQPVLAHAGLGGDPHNRIAGVLLGLAEDPNLRVRLEAFGVRRFAAVEEASYASVVPIAVRP